MKRIYQNLIEAIGNTPLVELNNISQALGLKARVVVKLERANPGGSVKDRAAAAMIADAEKRGILRPGGTIIEPTSGNTGVGLAWIAAVKGYRLILTMPETMSVERRLLLSAYGAQLVLTEGALGMKGAIQKAEELRDATEGAIILGQFDNPANPQAHRDTTAEEIWRDTDGAVDIFVAGVGTGGTISGTAEGLKAHNAKIKAVAVEPSASAVLSGQPAGKHRIQGIGAGFVPQNFRSQWVDEVRPVSEEDAIEATRLLAQREGLLVGISSGAAVAAAFQCAAQTENEGKLIVVLLPDTGERYLSMEIF